MGYYKPNRLVLFLILSVCIGMVQFLNSCNRGQSSTTINQGQFGSVNLHIHGKMPGLVKSHCSVCHLAVPPQILDKKTWRDHVLPGMAPRLGIGVWEKNQFYPIPGNDKKFGLTFPQWMKIVNFYKKAAPAKLKPAVPPVPLKNDWSIFKLRQPKWDDTTRISTTAMVAIDTLSHQIYSASATSNMLYRWGKDLKPVPVRDFASPPVNITFLMEKDGDEHAIVTTIGTLLAVDLSKGKVIDVNLAYKTKTHDKTIAKNLPRPVQAIPGDFNRDGLRDWIVCGFGHNTGALYEFQQLPDHKYKRMVIRGISGAEKAVVGDFNHDGWPDIMVLFAQAREGVWLFLNNHKGGFTSRNILRFLPVFGSTSIQVADFNNDGRPDILYTCGDNSDYSRILKPFHGVYIFLNEGNFHYKEAYFYPINGCTKAIAADFNKDGKMDIVTIAFFPDFKRKPQESFIYFQQDKPMHFIPHAIPIHKYGRWISMDAKDLNGNGYPDVVVGNFSEGYMNQKGVKMDWNRYLPITVLMNQSGHLSANGE